uniref:Uncharacterized protein n=1 Tax=Oryza meridionalis TaxID=40149 RepID=A0A0E0FBQ6_9ORYZ
MEVPIAAMTFAHPVNVMSLASWQPKSKRSHISPATTAHRNLQTRLAHHHHATPASLPMAICNTVDKVINRFIDLPEQRPTVDPRRVLSGNFAPVDELPPTSCHVIRGSIPSCLAGGVYIRNGPNPQHRLPRRTHHLFDGSKVADVPILSLQKPSVMHDFAITERYAIFPESQLIVNPMDMVMRGSSLVGLDRTMVPRIGVLPRYAKDESDMRWFKVPVFNMLHTTNAWEEADGEEIVLVAPNNLSIEHMLGNMELMRARVDMVRINLCTGDVSCTALSPESLEFGVIHQGYVGRKNRYGYFGVSGPLPKIKGIRKLDFDLVGSGDCTVGRRDFGLGCFAGEPFFVPDNIDGYGNEDSGYVVCYTHEEDTGQSWFVVMDAKSPELDIVAEVQLPSRIPYGFHGLFVKQAELLAQQ